MKDGLLEKIKGYGHWRVNIRPLLSSGDLISFQQCFDSVRQSSVSIRGWDFPHISARNDDNGGFSRKENFVEDWTDWNGFIEFWRMYRSTQFLSYFCLRSDTGAMGREISQHKVLNIVDAVYSITEFLEFSHRLYMNGLYKNGALLSVNLVSNGPRYLETGINRIPFLDPKFSESSQISIEKTLSKDILSTSYRETAIKILLELFDHFGWNPDSSQIRSDQEKFYNRDWSY